METEESEIIDNAWSMKIPEFKPEDNPHSLLEESSFSVLFPKYREEYIKESWPLVNKLLADHNIKAELDLVEGSMTVKTTRKTWDPYIIVKSRDFIRLLARCVPFENAKKVLEDEFGCDIIKIGSLVRNREKFIKRRKRLLGPGGCTQKSLELLTDCSVHVQGQTVAAVGPYKGLSQVRRVVEDTMRNIHPIYNIKALMIKRELARDPKLKNENWSRFLPHFKPKAVKRAKPKNRKSKKEYTPFPPPPTLRKVDIQLESGEYFMSERDKKKKKQEEIEKKNAIAKTKREEKRAQAFIPPEEPKPKKEVPKENDITVDIDALKKKVKKITKKKQ